GYSPMAIRIGDLRGDLGPVRLKDGKRLTGRVLDAQSQPLARVGVELLRTGNDAADEFIAQSSAGNGIRATAMTDSDGRFTLTPLPLGEYVLSIADSVNDPYSNDKSHYREHVDHAFVPMDVTIREDAAPRPIEVKANPHSILRGRFFDSQGKPRA